MRLLIAYTYNEIPRSIEANITASPEALLNECYLQIAYQDTDLSKIAPPRYKELHEQARQYAVITNIVNLDRL